MYDIFNYKREKIGFVKNSVYITNRSINDLDIKYNGFGISIKTLEQLRLMDVQKIKFYYFGNYMNGKPDSIILTTSLDKFRKSTLTHTYKDNGEFDKQKFVSIKEMEHVFR